MSSIWQPSPSWSKNSELRFICNLEIEVIIKIMHHLGKKALYPKKDVFWWVKSCSIYPCCKRGIAFTDDSTGKSWDSALHWLCIRITLTSRNCVSYYKINGTFSRPTNLRKKRNVCKPIQRNTVENPFNIKPLKFLKLKLIIVNSGSIYTLEN